VRAAPERVSAELDSRLRAEPDPTLGGLVVVLEDVAVGVVAGSAGVALEIVLARAAVHGRRSLL
jgi:hypothetical protein